LRILFIGDVVGAAGMTVVKSMLPDAILRWEVDRTVVNGEDSAGTGFGITEDAYQGIRGAGPTWSRWAIIPGIERKP
jgi:calcineurin-like phosphoesterase